MFFFLFLQSNVWASLHSMMYVHSLTLKGCFHSHLLKVESFCVLIEKTILKGGLTSAVCDMKNSLEYYTSLAQYQTCKSVMWKLKAPVQIHGEWILRWVEPLENRCLNICCPELKFIDSGFLIKEKEQMSFQRWVRGLANCFCEHIRHRLLFKVETFMYMLKYVWRGSLTFSTMFTLFFF